MEASAADAEGVANLGRAATGRYPLPQPTSVAGGATVVAVVSARRTTDARGNWPGNFAACRRTATAWGPAAVLLGGDGGRRTIFSRSFLIGQSEPQAGPAARANNLRLLSPFILFKK